MAHLLAVVLAIVRQHVDHDQAADWFEDARHLDECARRIGHVMQHEHQRRRIQAAVVDWQLLEVAALQGRAEECLEWLGSSGFRQVEVSDGLGLLGQEAKAALIRRAATSFTVVAEVGMKEPTSVLSPATWVELARADLYAGAATVIAEGRESGTVGLYAPDASVRTDVVDALVDHVGAERLLFEAPRKDQQAWLIRHIGPEVNLANVAPREALGLEALRLGLRADTTLAVHGHVPVPR